MPPIASKQREMRVGFTEYHVVYGFQPPLSVDEKALFEDSVLFPVHKTGVNEDASQTFAILRTAYGFDEDEQQEKLREEAQMIATILGKTTLLAQGVYLLETGTASLFDEDHKVITGE